MKALKSAVLSGIAASVLIVMQPLWAASYEVPASNAWAASSLMNDANFLSRIAQTWGDSTSAYYAVAYAGWAKDAAYQAWLYAPVGSYTETAASIAEDLADSATDYLWMLYVGDDSFLDDAFVAVHDASYWMSVTQLFAAWRY